jgi:hypothetical protein
VGILFAACGATNTVSTPSLKRTVAPAPASFQAKLTTSDGKVQMHFSITPNRLGMNRFVMDLQNPSSGKPLTREQAQIFTTMLDMDMGTGVVLLQSNGAGSYSAQGNLPMDGNWGINIQILDGADTMIHIAKLKVYTPA